MVPQDPDRSGLKGSSYRDFAQVALQDHASGRKGSSYRDLAQVPLEDPAVQKDPGAEILIQRSSTSDTPGSWYKWSQKVVLQDFEKILDPDTSGPKGSWCRDLAQVVLHDPDTSGPKDPDTESLHKWSYSILTEVVEQEPYTEILHKWSYRMIQVVQRSCTSDPTGPWSKLSERILIPIWILIQRSCTSGPTRSWILIQVIQKDPHTEILHKRSYRILVQVVQKGANTKILHKWSYRILIQVVQKDPHTEILSQRSCTSGPTWSCYKWSKKILIQSSWRQRSWTSGLTGTWKGSWHSGAKRSWYKRSKRILIQRSWNREIQVAQKRRLKQRACTSGPTGSWPHTEILRQRSCTSATIGSWYKWSKRILIQRSCYKCRANLPSLLVGVHSHTHTLFRVSRRDNFFKAPTRDAWWCPRRGKHWEESSSKAICCQVSTTVFSRW